MSGQRVLCGLGQELNVGTRVLFGAPLPGEERAALGTVVEITAYDVDYDDELQRPAMSNPRVRILFDDGLIEEASTSNITPITWADYPDGPGTYTFQADDILVADPS